MNKILIVDDAAFMRSVIRGILEKGGYDDFCEAEDGDVAFSRYRGGKEGRADHGF